MKIILKQNVQKLGFEDDLVEVKAGYARNFLIPNNFAVPATTVNMKIHNENVRQKAKKEEQLMSKVKELIKKLEKETLKIATKVGEKGRIFGSINTIQISDAIKKIGYEVDRKFISIKEDHIKNIGVYTATIKFHSKIQADIKFEVIGE